MCQKYTKWAQMSVNELKFKKKKQKKNSDANQLRRDICSNF